MEFELAGFKGKIQEPIGQKIHFFKVVGEVSKAQFIPLIFWLKTYDDQRYRFFIDARALHWVDHTPAEMEKLIEEDFEEYDSYEVRDIMTDYNLQGKTIEHIEMDYIENPEGLIGKLEIKIEGKGTIELLDFGDEKEQELKIEITQ